MASEPFAQTGFSEETNHENAAGSRMRFQVFLKRIRRESGQITQILRYFQHLIAPLCQPLSDLLLPPAVVVPVDKFVRSAALDQMYQALTGQSRLLSVHEEAFLFGQLCALEPLQCGLIHAFFSTVAVMHDVALDEFFGSILKSQDLPVFISFEYDFEQINAAFQNEHRETGGFLACQAPWNPQPVDLGNIAPKIAQFMQRAGVCSIFELVGKMAAFITEFGPFSVQTHDSNVLQKMQHISTQQELYNSRIGERLLDIFGFAFPATRTTQESRTRYLFEKLHTFITDNRDANRLLIKLRKGVDFAEQPEQTQTALQLIDLGLSQKLKIEHFDCTEVLQQIEKIATQATKYSIGEVDLDETFLSWPMIIVNGTPVDQHIFAESVQMMRKRKSGRRKATESESTESSSTLLLSSATELPVLLHPCTEQPENSAPETPALKLKDYMGAASESALQAQETADDSWEQSNGAECDNSWSK